VTPLSRACVTLYWNSIVTLCLIPFLILNVKLWRDLEAWVRGRSKSLKMVLFESLDTVYYLHSVVTMAVSCIILEIK